MIMNEIFLDTETTGLSPKEGHKIVEIACIETKDLIVTKKIFHKIINPERNVPDEAFKIHGFSTEFLKPKETFKKIVDEFIEFIKDKKIIIHNAAFDVSFLNYELQLINKKKIEEKNVIDTLQIARQKYPGTQNSLDALCKKFRIDNRKREKHNALLDCQLLKEVYINLLGQKEPKLNLESAEVSDSKFLDKNINHNNAAGKIINPTSEELELHKNYLKNSLPKNFF